MHEQHDLDLIAAYAAGDLDGDTSSVEELISSCPQCQVEYDTQQEIRAILQSAPPVAMTEEESEALHRAVHDQLERPVATAPSASVIDLATRRRSTRRWLAIGSVAAATVAVVGVAGILNGGIPQSETLTAAESADDAGELASSDRMVLQVPEDGAATTAADAAGADGSMLADTEQSDLTDDTVAASTGQGAPFLPYIDAGPGAVTGDELDSYVSETLTALDTGAPAEELTAEWFNTNEKPTPLCLASLERPLFAVINATVGSDTIEVLVVYDAETTLFDAMTFDVPDCTER